VPIDHVIGGLTDIAERMAAASGRTYHLVSSAPVPVAVLRTLALGYQHLHAPRFSAVGIWTIAARSTHHTQGPINFASRSAPADNQVVGASEQIPAQSSATDRSERFARNAAKGRSGSENRLLLSDEKVDHRP
jgi:hypothetical protein